MNNIPVYKLDLTERQQIEKQLFESYTNYADKLKNLSAQQLDEIQLKAIIKNDFDMMLATELANH